MRVRAVGFAKAKPTLQIFAARRFPAVCFSVYYSNRQPENSSKNLSKGWQEAKIPQGFSVCRRQTSTARIKDSGCGTWRGTCPPSTSIKPLPFTLQRKLTSGEVSEGRSPSDYQSVLTTCASGPQVLPKQNPPCRFLRPDVFRLSVSLFYY